MLKRLTFTKYTHADPQKETQKGFRTITGGKLCGILETENMLPVLYDGHPGWGEWQLQNARS